MPGLAIALALLDEAIIENVCGAAMGVSGTPLLGIFLSSSLRYIDTPAFTQVLGRIEGSSNSLTLRSFTKPGAAFCRLLRSCRARFMSNRFNRSRRCGSALIMLSGPPEEH